MTESIVTQSQANLTPQLGQPSNMPELIYSPDPITEAETPDPITEAEKCELLARYYELAAQIWRLSALIEGGDS